MKNIQIILNAILSSEIFEYILIDRKYRIADFSDGVKKYVENEIEDGNDIRDYFPEIFGYETKIQKVFNDKESRYILETVKKNDYYINIHLNHYSDDILLILLHNITEITLSKLKLLQYSNENMLLYSTIKKILDSQNNYIIVTTDDEVEYANKRFLEYFSLKNTDELNERKLCTFIRASVPIESYNDLYEYAKDEEKQIYVRNDVFLVKATLLEKTYKLFTFSNITQLNNINKELENRINIDPLTNLYKKPYFDKKIKEKLECNERFAVVVIDLDNFKHINDKYGHIVGDKILQEFVRLVKANLRNDDLFSRWGGEEFLILIESDKQEEISHKIEALRALISQHRFNDVGHLTASFGITFSKEGDTIESLLKRADDALYRAKNLGKNRVVTL
ncbi:GGDEF domain-containing protein [Nitratifractor sp.]|uniref:GGDEF domain-containing protein n=1 Tax=Nitratifractor sp. TaxID=2268144 RepID=UPI0025E40EA8|nr:GGDEF domain-containing protein [Nitratifractor sp.]